MGSYKLKAFIRYTSANKVVPGSLVLRKKIPKAGNWREIPNGADLCCTSTTTTSSTTTEA